MDGTQQLRALFDRQMRQAVEYPDMDKEVEEPVVRFLRPAPGRSQVAYARFDETTAGPVIEREQRLFAERGLPFDWAVYSYDRPTDLGARLARRGFIPDEPATVLVRPLDPAAAAAPSPPPGITLRKLTRPEQLEEVLPILSAVWNADFGWMRQRFSRYLALPGYLDLLLVSCDGEPACTGWTFYYRNTDFAGLWGGSTLPRFRGRGCYHALLQARIAEAGRRGRRFAFIEAGPMSAPIAARSGFLPIATVTDYAAPASPGLP